MKTVKQWLYLLLAVVIVVSLTSCASDTPSSSANVISTSSGALPGSITSNPNSQATVDPAEKDYSKRLTVTIGASGSIEGYDYTNGDPLCKYWADMFNMDFQMVALPSDQVDEMTRIWISSRDMPDVMIYNYTSPRHPDYMSYVEQDLLLKLPDDWKQKWPLAAQTYELTGLGPVLDQLNDGTYCLPRARFVERVPGSAVPLLNHMGYVLRGDWLEAVGMEVKRTLTLNEIIEYGKKVQEQDPSNVGANLTALNDSPGGLYNVFVGFNNTYNTYDQSYKKGEDGTYIWGPTLPETLEGIKLIYDAYTSGALNPEFYANTGSMVADSFRVTGTSGGYYGGATAYGLYSGALNMNKNLGLPVDGNAWYAITPLGTDGKFHQHDLLNYWQVLIFNPDIDMEVFERYMDYLEYGLTDEGYMVQTFGFEGEDYKWENGEMINLLPEGLTFEGRDGKYPSAGYLQGCLKLWDDSAFINPNIEKKYRDLCWEIYMDKANYSTPETFPPCDWLVFTYDSPAKRRASVNYATDFSNMVVTAKSVAELESLFNAWLQEKLEVIQPVLDEYTAAAKG